MPIPRPAIAQPITAVHTGVCGAAIGTRTAIPVPISNNPQRIIVRRSSELAARSCIHAPAAQVNVATDVGVQPIETITLNGESLRLEYTQSQIVPAVLTLTPDGENLAVEVEMDFPGGMFVVSTTATRME